MKNIFFLIIVLLFIIGAVSLLSGLGQMSTTAPNPPMNNSVVPEGAHTAVFVGGCFWGIEAVFENLEGVLEVVSGYSGGTIETADYDLVSSGRTGHAESVLITNDPSRISYGTLLKVFFTVAHDPTQLNYQGSDYGTQYRSAIFYTNDEQKRITEEYIILLEKEKVYPKPIVTQIVPFEAFFPAEKYHQDFLKRNPNHPYIVYWDIPKIEHLKKSFPELLTEQ